jgi:sec-independent protein translocase protein TatA
MLTKSNTSDRLSIRSYPQDWKKTQVSGIASPPNRRREANPGARYHGRVFGNVGPLEIVIVLIIALIVFGPKRLPELGRSLGKGIREFRGSLGGDDDDDDDDTRPKQPREIEGKGEPVAQKRP